MFEETNTPQSEITIPDAGSIIDTLYQFCEDLMSVFVAIFGSLAQYLS